MLNNDCEELMYYIETKHPQLSEESRINLACDMMVGLYVSQTFATTKMLYDKACDYYNKSSITTTELKDFIYDSICSDERRFDTVSNNHTVQVTENFYVNGISRYSEAIELCEG